MVLKSFASLTKLTWKPPPVWKPLEGIVTDVVVSPAVLLIVILLRVLTTWDCMTTKSEEGARKSGYKERTHIFQVDEDGKTIVRIRVDPAIRHGVGSL
jgi:hypothetical protein